LSDECLVSGYTDFHLGIPGVLIVHILRVVGLCAAAWAALGLPLRAQADPVLQMLDAYAEGRFESVTSLLSTRTDFYPVLDTLRREGPQWIAAAGPEAVDRRELVAATFALEATRAALGQPWKLLLRVPSGLGGRLTGETLYWYPPPLILEWACQRLRSRQEPHPAERWWQLAAISVAQRSEDFQFLVGTPFDSSIWNSQDEIAHLSHVEGRLPNEMRIQLAKAVAVEWRWPRDAVPAFRALSDHPDVGGEARVRLGVSQSRIGQHAEAVATLQLAEQATRDPFLVYLARLFRGRSLERLNRPRDAEAAYRAAIAATPGGQAATTALAGLLAADGRRLESQHVISRMLAVSPAPVDPWRVYMHADDRHWPYLIDRLRKEIGR
jgi:tetratricopeptide (TPR) repeat protein